MDLKPAPRPQPLPTQQMPATPQADPFRPDPPSSQMPSPMPQTMKKKRRGGKFKKFLLFVLILALLGGVGYGVYYWQHQQVDKLAKENAALSVQVAANQAKVNELEAEAKKVAVVPTSDEQIIAATTAYCQAQIDPATKKALVYTQGTSGTDKKKVLYSADKNFAFVNAACTSATTDKEADFQGYYLKLVGTDWVVLYAGKTADATKTSLYAIPTDFK